MKSWKIFLLVSVVVCIGLFATQKIWIPEKEEISQTTVLNQNEEVNTFATEGINSNQERAFGNGSPISFTSQKGTEISFAGTIVEARNPGSHVFLNKKEIGTVEGHGIVEANFSENGQRFVFSVMSICGADCVHKYNYEINLASDTLNLLK